MNTSLNNANSKLNHIDKNNLSISNQNNNEENIFFDNTIQNFSCLERVVRSKSYSVSSRYDPINFSYAVKAICNEYGLQPHQVEGPLIYLHVFGINSLKLSTEAIINLWDCHCHGDAANDSLFDDADAY